MRSLVLLLLGMAILATAYFTGRSAGVSHERAIWQAAQLKQDAKDRVAAQKVRDAEHALAMQTAQTDRETRDALQDLGDRYAALAASMSSRPARPSVPTTAEAAAAVQGSAGATGAGLYAEDGRFLAGEAARADTLRIALKECYARYDAAQLTMEALNAR